MSQNKTRYYGLFFNGPQATQSVAWETDQNFIAIDGILYDLAEGGAPGGTDTNVQFNNSGAFGGDSTFAFDPCAKTLTLEGLDSSAYILAIGTPAVPAVDLVASPGILMTGDLAASRTLEIHNNYAVGVDLYTHADKVFRAPFINFYKSGGTQASPTAVLYTGYELDSIGGINFSGYDGSAYGVGSGIYNYSDEDWSTSGHGAHLSISSTEVGQTSQKEIIQFGGLDPQGVNGGASIIAQYKIAFAEINYKAPAIDFTVSPATIRIRASDDSGDAILTASVVNVSTGFQVSGAATSGNVLRGNGTNFVSSTPAYAATDLVTQSAAITTTTLVASVPTSGLYRVSFYAKITTKDTLSSVLGGGTGFVVGWTDPTDSSTPTATVSDQSSLSLSGNSTTTMDAGSIVIEAKAGTAITYAYGYTAGTPNMGYKLGMRVEYLG